MNTVLFTIARMNPPTSGHTKLIQTMMEANIQLPAGDLGHGAIYIILSHTKDNSKNPLSCKRKREILKTEGMIDHIKDTNPLLRNINVTILCMDDVVPEECGKHPILKQVCHIRLLEKSEKGVEPTEMNLFIGEDRANSYTFITDSLEKREPPIAVKIVVLPRPEGAMSATIMRGLVSENKPEEFIAAVTENGLSPAQAKDLFDELAYEMTQVVISKKTPASKRRKLTSDEPTSSGGRKEKKRRTVKRAKYSLSIKKSSKYSKSMKKSSNRIKKHPSIRDKHKKRHYKRK